VSSTAERSGGRGLSLWLGVIFTEEKKTFGRFEKVHTWSSFICHVQLNSVGTVGPLTTPIASEEREEHSVIYRPTDGIGSFGSGENVPVTSVVRFYFDRWTARTRGWSEHCGSSGRSWTSL
jgi:hypothetical protein